MLYQRRCRRLFQSTLPHGSDSGRDTLYVEYYVISILAPSRERLHDILGRLGALHISILAPSRERHCYGYVICSFFYFNPRSLAGATICSDANWAWMSISILAPSRERLKPYGHSFSIIGISILAPSRERQHRYQWAMDDMQISILAPSRERPRNMRGGIRM